MLFALARCFCSCKRLGSVLPVFRSSARIHIRNGNSGNQSLTTISFTEQMTDSNTLCHSRARTRKCNYPRFTIKYIIHTRSSLHPRFPSLASILSTMPGQPSPNLSLSSLPIPSYRTIWLLPFSPSGSPSDYSGPNPHQMLTQNCNNTVQKPSALH